MMRLPPRLRLLPRYAARFHAVRFRAVRRGIREDMRSTLRDEWRVMRAAQAPAHTARVRGACVRERYARSRRSAARQARIRRHVRCAKRRIILHIYIMPLADVTPFIEQTSRYFLHAADGIDYVLLYFFLRAPCLMAQRARSTARQRGARAAARYAARSVRERVSCCAARAFICAVVRVARRALRARSQRHARI